MRERVSVGSDSKRDADAVSVELGEARRGAIKRVEKLLRRLVRPWVWLCAPIRAALCLFAHAAGTSLSFELSTENTAL